MNTHKSANEQIKDLFRIALGDDHNTQNEIDAFFESTTWAKYPDDRTWEEVLYAAMRHCTRILARRIKHQNHFAFTD